MMNEYIMHQLQRGFEIGIDLSDYIQYGIGTMKEIRHAEMEDIDLTGFVLEGYAADQLRAIRAAHVKHIDISPYLTTEYGGDSIMEILFGLEHDIDVSCYAKPCYSWRKMREIRLGMEHGIDVSRYLNAKYSYWQMREIRRGLEQGLNVDLYDSLMYTAKRMKQIRHDMLAERRRKQTEYTQICFEHGNLYISGDEMKAEIKVLDESWRPNVIELRELLLGCNITEGYDELAMIRIESGTDILGNRIVIARGQNSVPGSDGYYRFTFDTHMSYMPADEKDGFADYEKIHCIKRVLKGQTLATYYPASKGMQGRTLTGRTIYAPDGKELPALEGNNICLSEDGRTYLAEIDGRVRFSAGRLDVEEMAIISSNLWDEHELEFPGTVHITVDVPEGVRIHAEGDIIADGMVTGAVLSSEHNIVVRLGINSGGTIAKLSAKENVTVKYSEYAHISAGKNIYLNYSLNSLLHAKEAIVTFGKKGAIIGGKAYAERGFCISNVGNAMGRETILIFGVGKELKKRYLQIEYYRKTVNEEFADLKNQYEQLRNICGIHNSRSESAVELKKKINKTMKLLVYLDTEREQLYQRICKAAKAQVIVNHEIYQNVTFICNNENYSPAQLSHVVVKFAKGYFKVDNLVV